MEDVLTSPHRTDPEGQFYHYPHIPHGKTETQEN